MYLLTLLINHFKTVWNKIKGKQHVIGLFTSEMLSGSSQQLVENVEGAFIFGLTNGSGFFQ